MMIEKVDTKEEENRLVISLNKNDFFCLVPQTIYTTTYRLTKRLHKNLSNDDKLLCE